MHSIRVVINRTNATELLVREVEVSVDPVVENVSRQTLKTVMATPQLVAYTHLDRLKLIIIFKILFQTIKSSETRDERWYYSIAIRKSLHWHV